MDIIRETLYGSGPIPYMMESGMTSIRESLYGSPEIYSEFADLVCGLRLYSEETQIIMNEAISKTDMIAEERILRHINEYRATPRTSIYLLSIITAIATGALVLLIGGIGISIVFLGAVVIISIATVISIIVAIWNKIFHSKDLSSSQKRKALIKIIDDLETLEYKYRKANDQQNADRIAQLRSELCEKLESNNF